MNDQGLPSPGRSRSLEAIEGRFALQIAAALSELQAGSVSPDIDERLRFAREQALSRARELRSSRLAAPATLAQGGGTVALGASGNFDVTPWWLRLSALVPLAVLLAGLVLIDTQYTRAQVEAAAELDAAILSDDLPPEAYRDQGFVEFLKTSRP
jgi:Protein of unknown function (DUF3619)